MIWLETIADFWVASYNPPSFLFGVFVATLVCWWRWRRPRFRRKS